jgi:hypothetical protein
VVYLFKGRNVEIEKHPLLANSSETISVSRQQFGKHVSAATDTHATIEALLEMGFSARSVKRSFKEDNWGNRVSSVLEALKKRFSWKGAAIQRILKHGS